MNQCLSPKKQLMVSKFFPPNGDKQGRKVRPNLAASGFLPNGKSSEQPVGIPPPGARGIGVKNLGIRGENREEPEKSTGTVTGISCLLDLAGKGKMPPKNK